MTKNEFLSILRGRITGSIPTSEVESQLDYYSAYIDGRIGAGLTEEEAVEELGDPRLIAKTVIESTDRAAEAAGYDGRYRSSTDTYDDSDGINSGIFGKSSGPQTSETFAQSEDGSYYQSEPDGERSNASYRTGGSSGAGCIVAVVIFVILMVVAWILLAFVFNIGFWLLVWLLPAIAVAAIIALFVRMGRRK